MLSIVVVMRGLLVLLRRLTITAATTLSHLSTSILYRSSGLSGEVVTLIESGALVSDVRFPLSEVVSLVLLSVFSLHTWFPVHHLMLRLFVMVVSIHARLPLHLLRGLLLSAVVVLFVHSGILLLLLKLFPSLVLVVAHHAGQWVEVRIKLEEEFATVQFGLVEGVEGTLAALLGLELNDTAALGASVLILKNIYADNITCLAHVVFEVLPLGVPV